MTAPMLRPPPSRGERAFMVLVFLTAMGDPLLLLFGGADPSAAPTGGGRTLAAWVVFYAAATAFARPVAERAVRAATLDWPVLALLGLAAASTLWSVDPGVTAKRAVALAGTCVVAWYAAARFEPDELHRQLAVACAIAVAASYAYALGTGAGVEPPPPEGEMPGEAYVGAWRGMFATKNVLAQVASLAAPVLGLYAARARGRARAAALAAALGAVGLVWMTRSAMGLVVTAAAAGAVGLLLLLRVHPYAAAASIAAFAGAAGLAVVAAASHPGAVFAALGRDATLTGRTELWAVVVDQVRERPWLGWGHAAFWNDWASLGSNRVLEALTWTPGYSHNGYLDQALGLGLVGLALLVAALAGAARAALAWARRAPGAAAAFWPAVVVVNLALVNLTEGGILQQNGYMWLLLAAVSASTRLARAEARAPAAAAPDLAGRRPYAAAGAAR